jgi:transposase
MTKTIRFDKEDIDIAKKIRDFHQNEREYRAALVFLFMAEKKYSAKETAEFFGIGITTVFADLDRIRKPETLKKRKSGRRRYQHLSFEEEAEFLKELLKKAKEGKVLTIPELHREYDLRVGKETSESTFYKLLKRHKWIKTSPGTPKPEGDAKN